MQQLTTTGKLIAIVVILGLLYGGYKLLGGKEGITKMTEKESADVIDTKTPEPSSATDNVATDNAGNTVTSSAASTSSASSGNTSSAATDVASSSEIFNYTPPAPINGKLKGVVELGASGFNSFIVRIDKAKNWKLEKSEFGNSLVTENMATDDDIRSGLKKYIGNMLDFGVSGRDIHFVVSSGAQKAEVAQKIIKNLKMLGYIVNPVTAEQEGKYGFKAALPADYYDGGFMADIGSGNTKISWINAGKTQAIESYGAKYFQNNTDDATVYDDVKAKAKQVPSDKREICFIIGGVPFELAKALRKGKERYTVLNNPANSKAESAKTKAGVNIYKGLADGTGCKLFVFDWDANFTIGALLDLPY
jgi:hypothetical protein